MRILEHKSIISAGGAQHIAYSIEWFGRIWKIMINENNKKQITTIHVWDDGWRPIDNRTHEESIIHEYIKQNKLTKLKYKVQ